MICRLCLKMINGLEAIYLFQTNENNAETKVAKMIAKYFQLEITHSDTISTSICQDCYDHLIDFHNFWTCIDQKQSTLRNAEFLEVKCDVDFDAADNAESNNKEEEDELLLDLKDIPLMEDAAGVDAEKLLSQEFAFETKKSCKQKTNIDGEEDSSCKTNSEDDSTDDDTPLLNLKNIAKKRKPTTVKIKKTNNMLAPKSRKGQKHHKERISKRSNDIIMDFMQLSCDLCNDNALNTYDDLIMHFREVHNSPPYLKCCNRKFYKAHRLVGHITWHQKPDMFKCNICDKQLRNKKSLQMHKDVIHSDKEAKLHSCDMCPKQFQHPKSLENHMISHRLERVHQCEMCDKSFPTIYRLRAHVRCIHDNIFPYVCDICGRKFKTKPCFDTHVQIHQGIIAGPAQCNVCGAWLKNTNSLRRHRVKHDQKDLKCEFCNRSCPSKDALRSHIKYMHESKREFQCTFCEKSFKENKNLQEHLATHTGAQLYICTHCTREFRSKSNMYVHIKRNHLDEWLKMQAERSNDPTLKAKEAQQE